MPEVNGQQYPYTPEGIQAAQQAQMAQGGAPGVNGSRPGLGSPAAPSFGRMSMGNQSPLFGSGMMSMGGQLQSQVSRPVKDLSHDPMTIPSLNPDYWDQPMFKPNRPAHWPTHYTSPGVHSTTPGYGEPGDWGDFIGNRRLQILPDGVAPWEEQFKPLRPWTPQYNPIPPPLNSDDHPWLNPPKPPPPLWWDPQGLGRRENPGYPSGHPRPDFS